MDIAISRRRALVFGAAAALLPLTARAATRDVRSSDVFPAPGSLEFAVERNGAIVGMQRYSFREGSGSFVVRYGSELDVPLGGGRTWRYLHLGEEVWRDGWLDGLETETRLGEEVTTLSLHRRDDALYGIAAGQKISVSGYVITTSLWHRDTPFTQVLLGHEDGRTKVINVAPLGRESVATPAGPVEARRYALTGEIERNLWYGPESRLLKASWPGPGGEILVLRLQAVE